jgi:ATP-dependent Lhr-like helicase
MDVEIRRAVERGIASGELKWVVATSSLDLGIDFRPVRTVVQIGSPKSVGRFVQRSGRSNHAPGMSAEVIAVPTYALELLELEAVSSCSEKGLIEPRRPITAPIDVLCQHLMTLACGSGLREEEAWEQVRSTLAFSGLSPKEFSSVFDFVSSGGEALRGYEDYERLAEVDGRFRPIGRRVATLHRLSIGTITARRGIALQYTNGKRIGIAEERFVSQLKKGDVFVFAGRKLELVMVRGMKAYVRTTGARAPVSATWIGAGLPYSPVLARKVRDVLAQLAAQCHPGSRDEADRSLLFDALGEQASRSAFPQSGELLVERFASDLGFHLFLYPFEGRRVHEAIATLLAYRLSGLCEVEITISSDDNGAELLFPGLRGFPGFRDSDSPIRLNGEQELRSLLSPEHAEADLEGGLNIAELARREFRSIAQIAGLVHPGYPNAPVPQAELQTSADVLYDVLKKYDPNNLLLAEARRQVREDLLETGRLTNCLKRLQRLRFRIISLSRPTPFCFPLMAKRESASLSSESAHTRLQRLQKRWRIP